MTHDEAAQHKAAQHKAAQHMWSVLYDLVDGLEDMRLRQVIQEVDDGQFLDAKLAEARKAMKAFGGNVPPSLEQRIVAQDAE